MTIAATRLYNCGINLAWIHCLTKRLGCKQSNNSSIFVGRVTVSSNVVFCLVQVLTENLIEQIKNQACIIGILFVGAGLCQFQLRLVVLDCLFCGYFV